MSESLIDAYKLDCLVALLESTDKLDGDIVEVGVYKGGSARAIVDNAGQSKVFLFDTFTGMPNHDPTLDGKWGVGSFSDTSAAAVVDMFAGDKRVSVYPGVFPAETGHVLAGRRLRFVHLDVDNYESYAACLDFLYEQVISGGLLVFDDYGEDCCPGAKAAVDEFFIGHAQVVIEGPVVYVVKP
jgi:O-methyltransferase